MAQRQRKALIIVENLSVPFDRRVWREAKALAEAGYRVSVISPKGEDCDTAGYEEIDGIAVYRFRLWEAEGGLLAYALEYGHALIMIRLLALRVLLTRGFDVVQICNPPDLLFLAVLPFKLLGKRIVFDHHDLSPEVWVAKGGEHAPEENPGRVYRLLLWLEWLTFRAADAVMSTNESYKETAIGRGGVAAEDVFVVRNGLELSQLAEAAPNPELRGGKTHLILYVGMMGAQDGVDYLLRAVSVLRHELGRTDFRLLLLGSGPALPGLEAQAREAGLEDCVVFAGRVTHEACLVASATADVCVCPDPKIGLNDCSTLVKVLEYMSFGKPTVAFDLKETRFSAGEAALYATPNDEREFAAHVAALLDNPGLRAEMGEKARRRVLEGLAWDHQKPALLAAYERAYTKSGKAREGARDA